MWARPHDSATVVTSARAGEWRAGGTPLDALNVFVVLALVVAATALALASLLAVAARDEHVFSAVAGATAALFGRTGVISPAGIEILRKTVTSAAQLAGGLAVAAVAAALLLRRIARRAEAGAVEPATTEAACWPEERWWRAERWTAMAVGVIVVGALLRMPRLTTSLFYDEIFSIQNFAVLPLLKIPFAQIEANNHVLNSVLLHAMLTISPAEWVLRLPTYLASVGSLWLVYGLGRRIAGSLAGLLAVSLVATSPFQLWYATLARGYMLGLFFALLALTVLVGSSGPPTRRQIVGFAAAQAAAVFAIPTLAIVPALLVVFLLAGTFGPARRWTGIDPSSGTGRAWLTTALATVVVVGILQLPQIGFVVMRGSRGSADPWSFSIDEASEWLGLFQHVPTAAPAIAAAALAVAAVDFRRRPAMAWSLRFLLVAFVVSLLFFLRYPSPARAHLPAFITIVLCTAIAVRRAVTTIAQSMDSPAARPWVGGAAVATSLLAIVLGSGVSLVEAGRGYPLQDIRGAVRLSEAVVGRDGVIATSDFGGQEIAYYAARPVLVLRSEFELAQLAASHRPFCYFRLYSEAGRDDRVYEAMQRSAAPPHLVPGRDPISVWCPPVASS